MNENKKKLCIVLGIMALILLLSLAVGWLWRQNKALRNDVDLWRSNSETLVKGATEYLTVDSLHVARIKALEMSEKEYKAQNADYKAQIAKLKKDSKSKVVQYTEVTKIDTLIISESHHDTIYMGEDTCLSIVEPYFSYLRCGDDVKIVMEDTIRQVVSKHYKHRFLWWRWKADGISQDIWSSNPNSHIIYDEFVKFEE